MGEFLKTIDFLTKIQGYYNLKYTKGTQLNMIATYISGKSEYYLDCLFIAVTRSFSGQYKTLPDIAIFEKLTDVTYEIIEEQKRKAQIADLSRPQLTDGDEVDYSEEMKGMFAKMDKRFRLDNRKDLEDENGR